MNIETGKLLAVDDQLSGPDALLQRLVPVDLKQATEKQLQANRSKYSPHVGAKERAKAAQNKTP